MSRYIDANKAIEIWKDQDYIKLSSQETNAKIMLDAVPSADVVEVVRCKDCKRGEWRVSGLDNKTKGYRCAIHAVLGFDFGDNGYCSYGERKEQENE